MESRRTGMRPAQTLAQALTRYAPKPSQRILRLFLQLAVSPHSVLLNRMCTDGCLAASRVGRTSALPRGVGC